MNPRLLLVIAALLALGVALAAWFPVGSASSDPAPALIRTAGSAALSAEIELAHAEPVASPADPRALGGRRESIPSAAEALRQPVETCTTGRLVGRVTSTADHATVPNALVTATWIADLPQAHTFAATVLADARGHFEFDALDSGTWMITCAIDGFAPFERRAWVPDGDRERVVDIVLVPMAPPQTIAVHLRGLDGRSLRDPHGIEGSSAMRVVCLDACPPRGAALPRDARILPNRVRVVPTNDAERLHVPPQADDLWFRIELKHEVSGCLGLLLGDQVIDTVAFGPRTKRVEMVVPRAELPGSVKLVVIDDVTGHPLNNASVMLRSQEPRFAIAHTDRRGLAVVEIAGSGSAVVEVNSIDHVASKLTAVLRPGMQTDLGVVRLVRK